MQSMTNERPNLTVASEDYRMLTEMMEQYARAQIDYGKWLLTTLGAIHAGTLFVAGSSPLARQLLSGPFLAIVVAGLVLALLSGFLTWANFAINTDAARSARLMMLANEMIFPRPYPRADDIDRTYRGSIVVGFLSAGCIPIAALLAWRAVVA